MHLAFNIQDTGIGMDELFLANIFEKFQQEDVSISRKFGGTGLGLFITKQLVELMDGRLKVKSEKGVGSEVHVCIPLSIGDISKVDNKETFANNNLLSNARILLVEDNEMNRVVACNALKIFNVEVTEAENGFEAVELLKKESFDLILMDIQMPVMNGIEATRIIRKTLKNNTPVIALSANALKTEVEACMAIGMNEYITKPFEEKELFQVMARHYKKMPKIRQQSSDDNSQSQVNELLYDLTKLNKMSMGNVSFVKKMLQLFVDNFPGYIQKMNDHFEKGDFESLKSLAHKIKPSLNDMGVMSIQQDILDLEHMEPSDNSSVDIKSLVDKVSSVLSLVVKQIIENEF